MHQVVEREVAAITRRIGAAVSVAPIDVLSVVVKRRSAT
jgi:hypothetical protein